MSRLLEASCLLICLFSIFAICSSATPSSQNWMNVEILQKEQLKDFKEGNDVRVLYYFKRDLPRLRAFFKELDKSAGYLALYGVRVGVYDCTTSGSEGKCQEDRSEYIVFTYSHGNELMQLEIETMFDVNSIMSNVLQLVLLREVPILQTKEERVEYENRYKGKQDIVFTYQKAIGTYGHRIFMEIAYAYQDKFKFAVSTSTEALDGLDYVEVDQEAMIWVLDCSKVTQQHESYCPNARYSNPVEFSYLATFVKTLSLPRQFHIPSDGESHPFTKDSGLNVVTFYYRETTKDIVMKMVGLMLPMVRGNAGLVTIDIEKVEGYQDDTPQASLQLKTETSPVFMQEPWSTDGVFDFVLMRLDAEYRKVDKSESQKTDQPKEGDTVVPQYPKNEDSMSAEDSYIEEVETQDDEVADAVFRARRNKMDLELVPMLTDKTFPMTVKTKDLLLVLFYLPFDDRSMAFLRAYGEASRNFENDTMAPLASVNCYDWTDVCGKEKITLYPTVRIFRNGQTVKDYDGMLDSKDVVKTVKLLTQPSPVTLTTEADVQKFMEGPLPKGDDLTNAIVLGLFDTTHSEEVKAFERAADTLQDKFLFGISANGKGKHLAETTYGCSLPCVVVKKQSDSLQPFVKYDQKMEDKALVEFIKKAQIPVLSELTTRTFPQLYAAGKPFVIAFLDDGYESQALRDIVSQFITGGKFNNFIFTWLSCSGSSSFGRQILEVYNKGARVPALSCVNLKQGKVYNYVTETFDKNNMAPVITWLTGVSGETLPVSTQLPEGEHKPLKEGYNFLDFIDERKKKELENKEIENKDYTTLKWQNEQGVGFDQDGNEISSSELNEKITRDDSADDEIRNELLELQRSRLYHHADGRKSHHSPQNAQKAADESVEQTEKIHIEEMPQEDWVDNTDEQDEIFKKEIPSIPSYSKKSENEESGKKKHSHEEL